MGCRIHVTQDSAGSTVRLDGLLTASQAAELVSVCADASRPLRIDLSDLLFVDATGFDAIQRLVARGAELVGVAQYLRCKMGRM